MPPPDHHRHLPHQPGRAPLASPELRPAEQPVRSRRREAVRQGLGQGGEVGPRHGPARLREPDRPHHPHLRPGRAAAFRRHQHLPQGTLCRERARRRQVRRRRARDPVRLGTTYRPGTRFGLQGIRRISALYTTYNFELGVDLREQMTLCDAGDVFTIPGNREELRPDQPRRGARRLQRCPAADAGRRPLDRLPRARHRGARPRRSASCISTHIDMQEKDLDERMHTTPWYWATELPNVSARTWSRSASAAGRCRGRA